MLALKIVGGVLLVAAIVVVVGLLQGGNFNIQSKSLHAESCS